MTGPSELPAVRITHAGLVRVAMPLVRPFRTSFGTQTVRDALLVHVVDDPDRMLTAWTTGREQLG